jgi:hypothetical protein
MRYGNPLRILMAMVGLVLLIAMTNVVMLLMARNAARQREFSVRQALGAGRGELLRQLLAESLILVSAGGALAWGFAEMATRLLASWAQIESSLAPDRTVLLFTLGVLVLAAVLFGLAPLRTALAGGAELALKTSAATSNTDAGKSRTGRIIVAIQMALCVVLLVGGGLLIRTLRNLENTPLGMQVDGLVVFGVKPNITSIPEGTAFYVKADGAAARFAWRGVRDGDGRTPRLRVVGQQRHDGGREAARCCEWIVEDGPKQCGGAGVLSHAWRTHAGRPRFCRFRHRNFAPRGHHQRAVCQAVLSQSESSGPSHWTRQYGWEMTIVGVVKDHKYRSIDEEPIPMAWYMYAQIPMTGAMQVEMRVHGEPLAILPSARKALQQINPNLPLIQPMTQRAQYDTTISGQILFARLAGFFGFLAVVLVATGSMDRCPIA